MLRLSCAKPHGEIDLLRRAQAPSYRAPRARDVLHPRMVPGRAIEYETRDCRYENGVLVSISLSGRAFLSHAKAIFNLSPIREVCLIGIAPYLSELAQCPDLARLTSLNLGGNRIGASGLRELLASPFVTNLRQLNLNGNDLGERGLHELLQSGCVAQLTHLQLADNQLQTHSVSLLNQTRHPHLTHLELSENPMLSCAAIPSGLQSLKMSRCGLAELAGAFAQVDTMHELDLSTNPLGEAGCASLFTDCALDRVKVLDLSFVEMGSAGVALLTQSSAVESVAVLKLRGNRINTDGAKALAAADFRALVELDLGTNPISDDGAIALIGNESLGQLETLSLVNCGLTDAGVRRLVATGALGGLRSLSLAWNSLGDAAMMSLARCPDLAGLRHLDLTGTRISYAGAIALHDSVHLSQLRTITLGENHALPPAAAAMLHQRYNGGNG